MDEAYQQHSHHGRRKNRSSTNLNRLTLAPLTTKLPLDDELYDSKEPTNLYSAPPRTTSYIQGKSAPTTPGVLTRSPAHSRTRSSGRRASVPHNHLPKSKSASHLAGAITDPSNRKANARRSRARGDEAPGPDDSDWLMRAGVLMSTEAREYKGQTWLTSRESSTSLAGAQDPEEEAYERELARERELAARRDSRRGSLGDLRDHHRSARASRAGSRSISRVGSRVMTPAAEGRHSLDGGYFGDQGVLGAAEGEMYEGPDFVNLDEKLEAIERDTTEEDEAAVRKLVRGGRNTGTSWFGWSLFSVAENAEESDNTEDDDEDDETDDGAQQTQPRRRSSAARHFEGVTNAPDEKIPAPNPDRGGWSDAAWLLSVASKVIL